MAFTLNPFTGKLDSTGMTASEAAAYLKLDQTTPQTTVGNFSFPLVSSGGYSITGGTHTDGKFLRCDGNNAKLSTLILPNAATQYQLVLATATNTYGGDAGLTYNTSTDVLTVQKRITISGGTVIADGLYSTGTFYVTAIKGLAGTGQGSTVYLYSGDGGDNPNPGLGGAGGTIYALSGTGGTGITTGGTGGQFFFGAGGGGTATAATGATGGAGGGFQLTAGNGASATGCTSGTARGGTGGACSFASGSGGGTGTISGTATSVGGTGGDLTFTSGSGSQSNITGGLASNTGGAGGNVHFGTGAGGRGRFGVLNVGGDGGYLEFSASQGGATTASGGVTTSNTGGNGGKLDFSSGSGASVSSASVTNIGGNAGDITFSAGLGGTGATSNGANGHILFKSSTTEVGRFDNTAGAVGNFRLALDNQKIQLGTGQDTAEYYDGTDLIINPQVVGTGNLKLAAGSVNSFVGYQVQGTAGLGTVAVPLVITTAQLTALGAQGSMTFIGGILTAQTAAT
jgi:hypothetical protein